MSTPGNNSYETQSMLIQALLSNPACYDHPVSKLELIETHISWVVLTGIYVYKIKKPVNLGFLDFSTLALRHQDCIEELRLNRRLAADIYLEVVAIRGQVPHINGSGEVLEYAVKMRQFPVDATLDKLIARNELSEVHIDALAARLTIFHQTECEIAGADTPWGEPEIIARPVAENFQILAARLDDPDERAMLDDLQDWCSQQREQLTPLMRERKKQGWVRECHGDLHLANLAWVDEHLVIFDCLEFSPALRWIDVISEVAFCYMDLLHRNRPDLAQRFLNGWLEKSGDYRGVLLLRYYAVYRAMVRAKVAALRSGQVDDALALQAARAELMSCLQLAIQLIRLAPSQLWITHGLSGSGKTTVTQGLLQQHGLIRLRSDVERKRLLGESTSSGIAQDRYTPEAGRLTYQYLAYLAETLLQASWSVVIDAAFLERWQRDLFRELAQQYGANFQILDIQADPDTLRKRVMQRTLDGRDASEADLRVLEHQLETAKPLGEDELDQTMIIAG